MLLSLTPYPTYNASTSMYVYICMEMEVRKVFRLDPFFFFFDRSGRLRTGISGSSSSREQVVIIPRLIGPQGSIPIQRHLFFSSLTRLSSFHSPAALQKSPTAYEPPPPSLPEFWRDNLRNLLITMGFSSKLVAGDSQDGGLEIPKAEGEREKAVPLRCPRCESTNTKFCYYNNYNKSQPRHFCRACRRHWTDGGTLRNVPVGGGRKNKRRKTAHNASTSTGNNGIAQHQRQQQQMPLPPFDDGDGRSSIFPGILHQVPLRQPPPLSLAYAIDGSALFPMPPFLPEFVTAEADLSCTSEADRSCSSPCYRTRLDSFVGEDGLAAWKAPTPLPTSYLSCCDEMSDLVNAQDSILSTYP